MRVLVCLAICLLAVDGVRSQETSSSSRPSLTEILGVEEVLSYRIDADTELYVISILTPQDQVLARKWYTNKEQNESALKQLETQLAELRKSRNQADRREKFTSLVKKRLSHQRPNHHAFAGEVTRHGPDYIGLREFRTNRELLIPLHRIGSVRVPAQQAEQ